MVLWYLFILNLLPTTCLNFCYVRVTDGGLYIVYSGAVLPLPDFGGQDRGQSVASAAWPGEDNFVRGHSDTEYVTLCIRLTKRVSQ